MPLEILLAASWIDPLSLAEIAREIERSFEFLESDWRDLPERQRSMRAVFEHSWHLLTEAERSAMCCLSVCWGVSPARRHSKSLWHFLMSLARYEEGIALFGRAVSELRAFPAIETRDLALGEVLHNVGFCLFLLGLAAVHLGDYEEAYHVGEEALQHLEQAGDSYYQGL